MKSTVFNMATGAEREFATDPKNALITAAIIDDYPEMWVMATKEKVRQEYEAKIIPGGRTLAIGDLAVIVKE